MPKARPLTSNPWVPRIWAEFRAGNVTRAWRDVLLTLRTFQGIGGACWPSHATLADRTGTCVRTVQRALEQGRYLGLVTWSERRVRAGWRWLRTSNAYSLTVPEDDVQPDQRRRRPWCATTGQMGRREDYLRKKEAIQAFQAEAARGPDLLAMRRDAVARGIVPIQRRPNCQLSLLQRR